MGTIRIYNQPGTDGHIIIRHHPQSVKLPVETLHLTPKEEQELRELLVQRAGTVEVSESEYVSGMIDSQY